jgi:DNA-binding response OmpR family regulator
MEKMQQIAAEPFSQSGYGWYCPIAGRHFKTSLMSALRQKTISKSSESLRFKRDVTIWGIHTPKMEGLVVLQRIQKDDCVIIILTALTDEFYKEDVGS